MSNAYEQRALHTTATTKAFFQAGEFHKIGKPSMLITTSESLLELCDYKDHKMTDMQWTFLYHNGWMTHDQLMNIAYAFLRFALTNDKDAHYEERVGVYQKWTKTPRNIFLCTECGGNPDFIFPQNKSYVSCSGCWPGIFVLWK